jgi:membrane protease YdiL (CAAX protease family)
MQRHLQTKQQTIRHMVVFSVVVVVSGWLGLGVDLLLGTSATQGPGELIWLVLPLGTVLLLRTFAGDGWKDFGLRLHLRKHLFWYAFSVGLYPLALTVVVLLGLAAHLITLPHVSIAAPGGFLQLVALGCVPLFIKNIFEEGAWRGYLTPKLDSLGWHPLVGHTLVGVIWASWHIPYYLAFLSRAEFSAYTTQSLISFFPLLFAGTISYAMVYGEVRLLTRSIWPTILLHTIGNAWGNTLILQGFIMLAPGADAFVSPGPASLLSIVLFSLIGVGLSRYRTRKASDPGVAPQFDPTNAREAPVSAADRTRG